MDYQIVEIFSSVQGEGDHMGKPCTFIRLAGCNLRCPWCDTKKSWNALGQTMDVAEIVAQVKYPFAVITGGEPLMHALTPLYRALKRMDCYIAIETNGTIRPSKMDEKYVDWFTASPKPPQYALRLQPNELKYVVDDEFSVDVIPKNYVGKMSIWLQPEASEFQFRAKTAVDIALKYPALRVGLQMHKILGVE